MWLPAAGLFALSASSASVWRAVSRDSVASSGRSVHTVCVSASVWWFASRDSVWLPAAGLFTLSASLPPSGGLRLETRESLPGLLSDGSTHTGSQCSLINFSTSEVSVFKIDY